MMRGIRSILPLGPKQRFILWALGTALLVWICISLYSYYSITPQYEIERTHRAIAELKDIIASQDKVIERHYNTTIKEVKDGEAEIRIQVQALPADGVARELNHTLDEHRRERGD